MTGIRGSRKGGVIKPMRKLDGRVRDECVSDTAELGEGWGVSGAERVQSSLVAVSRIAARRGRSLED